MHLRLRSDYECVEFVIALDYWSSSCTLLSLLLPAEIGVFPTLEPKSQLTLISNSNFRPQANEPVPSRVPGTYLGNDP